MQWFKGLFTGLSSSKEENSNMTTIPYFYCMFERLKLSYKVQIYE